MADKVFAVPGRATVLASSWVFIVASVFLLAEFLAIHKLVDPNICNWLGTVSDVGWFMGFALLIDWLVFYIFPAYGGSRRALIGATLKLIASVLFLVQPFGGLVAPDYQTENGELRSIVGADYKPGVGVPWSNLAGILFFHGGNCVDSVGMFFTFDRSAPFAWANWPVWGMWVYCSATWLLVFGNAIYFFSLESLFAHPTDPSSVEALQYGGASLLLIGSVIYTAWAHVAVEARKQQGSSTITAPLAAPEP